MSGKTYVAEMKSSKQFFFGSKLKRDKIIIGRKSGPSFRDGQLSAICHQILRRP